MFPSLILAIVVIAGILLWELRPPGSGAVIAVLGPERDLRHTVIETNAFLVSKGRLPNSYVLYSRAPDFPARLRKAGVLFVMRSDYSGSCYQPSARASTSPQSRWQQIDKGVPYDQVS